MICYLDCDGCLVDFIGGVCHLFGTTYEELCQKWEPGEWDIAKPLGMTEDQMWSRISNNSFAFWEGLNPTQDGKDILAWCEDTFDDVVLMTSPPRDPMAAAGKVAWIESNLGDYFKTRKFAVTPVKEMFAHPNATLIDDSDSNVKKFFQARGEAMLVPRRWNKLHMLSDWKPVRYENIGWTVAMNKAGNIGIVLDNQ